MCIPNENKSCTGQKEHGPKYIIKVRNRPCRLETKKTTLAITCVNGHFFNVSLRTEEATVVYVTEQIVSIVSLECKSQFAITTWFKSWFIFWTVDRAYKLCNHGSSRTKPGLYGKMTVSVISVINFVYFFSFKIKSNNSLSTKSWVVFWAKCMSDKPVFLFVL